MCDFLAYWMPEVAQQCRAQLVVFGIFSATLMCPTTPAPSYTVQDDKEEKDEFGMTAAQRGGFKLITGCNAICARTCREFEADSLDRAQSKFKNKPIVPVGVLPPSKIVRKQKIGDDASWEKIFKWVDRQIQGSVVYVTFGSEVKLTKHEVYEIAYGLELSQLPFIWALAKPSWAKDDSDALPPDFSNRTSEKGIVCLGWAPQLEILAHASVGGVLFHGGWSTTLETVQHGHNAIILPGTSEQCINARLMVEKGLGVEVERKDDDGSYTRNNVADALRRAMIGDEAHKIKAKVIELARIFGDHDLQERYVTNFIEFLKQYRENNEKVLR